jgi:hypothetical protein
MVAVVVAALIWVGETLVGELAAAVVAGIITPDPMAALVVKALEAGRPLMMVLPVIP